MKEDAEESGRCLGCSGICENCVEVCPNRANISIRVPGMEKHQIIHVDYMCNECGNCKSFCPYDSAPYLDKFTLFADEKDMEDSKNQGFAVLDKDQVKCKVRFFGETYVWTKGEETRIPEGLQKLMETVCKEYAYLWCRILLQKEGVGMKLLFKGGTIVSGDGMKKLDILVKGEKILAAGEDLEFRDAQIVDVRGKLLFPGFIDAHTHMALEVSNTITADKFETGTKAELAGGTTCIVDYATQYKGESLREALNNWHKKADGQSSCDYAFHLALTDWNEEISRELEEIVQKETCSFKLYMTYDTMVDDETMYEILSRLKELGGIAGVHCENNGIIQARLKEVEKTKGGRTDVSDYPWTRPKEAEAEAVRHVSQDRQMCGYTGHRGTSEHCGRIPGDPEGQRGRADGLCGDVSAVPCDG